MTSRITVERFGSRVKMMCISCARVLSYVLIRGATTRTTRTLREPHTSQTAPETQVPRKSDVIVYTPQYMLKGSESSCRMTTCRSSAA